MHASKRGFISVGALVQESVSAFLLAVDTCLVYLRCLVKRKQALRERNLSRDSQAEGAPTVHQASEQFRLSEAVLLDTFGHPSHTFENSTLDSRSEVRATCSMTVRSARHLVRLWVVASNWIGGMSRSILHYGSGTTGRCNSSLRSHRTWRSSCRHVFSGLNKTLFASVGPNSHCRGYRLASRAEPRPLLNQKQHGQLGRIKPGRGHCAKRSLGKGDEM